MISFVHRLAGTIAAAVALTVALGLSVESAEAENPARTSASNRVLAPAIVRQSTRGTVGTIRSQKDVRPRQSTADDGTEDSLERTRRGEGDASSGSGSAAPPSDQ